MSDPIASPDVAGHESAAAPTSGGQPRRTARLAPFVVLAVAAVLAALFVVLADADPSRDDSANSPLLGKIAPDAVGELEDGARFDLSRRKGSWVVLNFFASDCVPCQNEHPQLVSFAGQQQRLGADGAELYTVVFDDRRDRVEAFFAEHGGDWPVVYDDDGSLAVAFGVSKVPETWIVDPSGIVRARFISEVTADGLSATLQQLREQS